METHFFLGPFQTERMNKWLRFEGKLNVLKRAMAFIGIFHVFLAVYVAMQIREILIGTIP